ncbi:MAG: amidohydrolase family protein [Xanthobacteraceae bacterium]|nr:amidohydrolase family protein [Xanthobacteraceae bacterium]
MFDLVIRNGRLVSPDATTPGTIGISGSSIAAIAPPGEQIVGANEIDATGMLILPGLVDAHVHIPGFLLSSRLDDFTSASKAAAAGGVTTVLLMPTDDPRTATPFYFEQKRDSGIGRSYIDYALQAIVGPMSESIDDLAALGAVSFELFLAYGGMPNFIIGNDDYELARTLRLIRDVGGIAGITPHSPSLIARLTAEHRDDPDPTVATIAATRSILSEALGIARACTAAADTGAQIHIRAVSSRQSLDLIRRFKDLAALSSEVMSHHLLFDAEDAKRMGAYGVITPPLRHASERAALQDAVRAGEIDMVVSDHSPHLREDKERGQADIWTAPPGMTGLQTLCASMLALIDDGKLTLQDMVRTCCENPARWFRLYPRKGTLRSGADADIVILNPSQPTLISDSDQHSKADYTTLAGRKISARIERVLLRGQTIFADGGFPSAPTGGFVRP